jgi:hypothetical protein
MDKSAEGQHKSAHEAKLWLKTSSLKEQGGERTLLPSHFSVRQNSHILYFSFIKSSHQACKIEISVLANSHTGTL